MHIIYIWSGCVSVKWNCDTDSYEYSYDSYSTFCSSVVCWVQALPAAVFVASCCIIIFVSSFAFPQGRTCYSQVISTQCRAGIFRWSPEECRTFNTFQRKIRSSMTSQQQRGQTAPNQLARLGWSNVNVLSPLRFRGGQAPKWFGVLRLHDHLTVLSFATFTNSYQLKTFHTCLDMSYHVFMIRISSA